MSRVYPHYKKTFFSTERKLNVSKKVFILWIIDNVVPVPTY